MSRLIYVQVCLSLLLCLAGVASAANKWATTDYLPDRLIVDFSPDVTIAGQLNPEGTPVISGYSSLDTLFKQFEIYSIERLVPDGILARLKVVPDVYHTYVVRFRKGIPALEVLDALAQDAHVRVVVPDLLRRAFRIPNDQLWSSQWDKVIVHAPAVWDVCTGSRSIICAGIDTGIDWNHPDLVPNLWVNPGEDLNHNGVVLTSQTYPGDEDDIDGLDNDSSGYVDDLLGWDFIHNIAGCSTGEDCDAEMDNDMSGMNPHGTHTAGIMVAAGNNSIGVCGMSWNSRLMALRAGYNDPQQNGYMPEDATVAATYYAAAMGANILNMSYGGSGYDPIAQTSINTAWNQGCMIFAASGNDGDTVVQYPAHYDNVISVNATDSNDHLAYWSNRGSWTDLCAPGGDPGVMSTVINTYEMMEGTSMASPNAAGVAALVWSAFPHMTNAQVRDLLFSTAVNINSINPGLSGKLGHGRVDAQAAVASLYPQLSVSSFTLNDSTGGDGDGRLEWGESARLTLTVSNGTGWSSGQNVSVVVTSSDPRLTIANDSVFIGTINTGQSVNTSTAPVTITASSGIDTAYNASVSVTFSSPNGYAITQALTFRVGRGKVLVVDDDGGAAYQQYYLDAVTSAGVSSELWSVSTSGTISSAELLRYPAVIWSCGDQSSSTLTAQDQTNLMTYLDAGRNLLLVGQNIDEDLHGSAFYASYLHAQSASATGDRQLNAVSGNPSFAGMSLLLQGGNCGGNGNLSPSKITPVNGAISIFDYSSGGSGAIQYSGDYKLVYFSCALEAACGLGGTTRYDAVVGSILGWMGALDVPEAQRSAMPATIALHDAYPNPFNPTTTLSFDLNLPGMVTLQVFDLLGRTVSTLIHEPMSVGTHSVVFDGASCTSGVYLVRLTAGGTTRSSKIVLIK